MAAFKNYVMGGTDGTCFKEAIERELQKREGCASP